MWKGLKQLTSDSRQGQLNPNDLHHGGGYQKNPQVVQRGKDEQESRQTVRMLLWTYLPNKKWKADDEGAEQEPGGKNQRRIGAHHEELAWLNGTEKRDGATRIY